MAAPPSPDAHWRDSARYPQLFFIDARAVFPLLLCLLHIRLWTIAVTLLASAFFAILNRYGFTLAVFGRWVKCKLAGKRKSALPWWLHNPSR